ncbi:myomegalin-like [Sinocyclocheilus grahami]|uniref:myomegalin-like n=1 Tax=Sinocyclocheilus grahami TaxID=75366 RepID=UPI0007AD5092|nr:PREDICTED: myomegalin-like [Sinocyclocheilus grahami]
MNMRDPCRVCGVCVQGGQCRWLFSACGRLRLAVILSHVLGVELQRDGCSEFLCGKCVFLLERIVQCDVAIGQLQETHAAQLQRLQNERDGLKAQITNKYRQHNPTRLGGNVPLKQEVLIGASLNTPKQLQCIRRPQPVQPKKHQTWIASVQETLGRSHGVVSVISGGDCQQDNFNGRLRRCVSLEPLSKTGTDLSQRSKLNPSSRQSSKTAGVPVTRPRSLSRDYLDVVNKKSALISRSTSLQSVALEQFDHALVSASPLRQTRPLRGSTPATIETTSLVFDILQLLKSVQGVRPVPRSNSGKIPVLKNPHYTHGSTHSGVSWKSKLERSLRELDEDFNDEYTPLKQEVFVERQNEWSRLEQKTRQLTEEQNVAKSSNQTLKHTLEETEREMKALSDELEEREIEMAAEKKNSLKRDKTIQGLSLVLKEKEKEIEDLSGDLEEKDQALAKAREALHKAKLQKYQGAEDQQSLFLEQQAELSRLQAEARTSLLETQRLQRVLGSRDSELCLLHQAKLELEQELEQLQQQKKKGDKTINDLQNQLKKLNGALADRENALEQQRLEQQEQNRAAEQKLQNAIERLTASLNHKDKQLQDYMNMVKDLEKNKTQEEGDPMLAKLRARLKEKEKALEQALDEKFAAMEEKENEIHLLQLSLREKERDVERLNNLLSHNEETINSFDALINERDLELQQLLNSLKNLQRCKDETEQNLQRALREKDAIIQHLQQALDNKTRDMEEMANRVLSQSESQGRDLAEQMSQRLKVTEAMLSEAVKDRERLVTENQTAVENLLATISSKDQLLKELHQRLSPRGDIRLPLTRDQASQLRESECSISSLPQRERTIIGGDRQQQDVASLSDLLTEQMELNRALRAEQHLYSDLIRAVKERDGVERLQALQLELTGVSLLREQLESGVKMNTELRDQLQKEIQRAKQREGSNPSELESMRDALEEAQRWNASLQARLGQIQNRGGGVGQANDSDDVTLMPLNTKERCDQGDHSPEDVGESNQPSQTQREQSGVQPTSRFLRDESEKAELRSLLSDCGAESVSQLREQVAKLRLEASELRGFLKEENATESKESAESSGESDSHGDLHQTVKVLRSEARSHRKIIRLLKEQLQQNSVSDAGIQIDPAYVKSRLPVPVWPSRSSGQSSEDLSELNSGHVHPRNKDYLTGAEESDYSTDSKMSSRSAEHKHLNLDHVKDARLSPTAGTKQDTNMNQNLESELVAQLELLNQECQEKEDLISHLRQQVQEWDELQAEIQEKDKLNREYLEALQAAESTIAYLTACSLDLECGIGQTGDVTLQQRCADLQKALEEKDRLNAQLLDCLNSAESAIALLRNVDTTSSQMDLVQEVPKALSERLEDLIGRIRISQQSDDRSKDTHSTEVGPVLGPDSDLRRQVESLQESLLQQCRMNAELQEKLWTSEAAVKKLSAAVSAKRNSAPTGLEGNYTPGPVGKVLSLQQQQLTDCLSECIRAAEGTVKSFTDVCSKPNQSHEEILSSPELKQWLERLQRALLERESLEDPACTESHQQKTSTPIHNLESSKLELQQSVREPVSSHQNLHKNLLMLLQIHTLCAQKMNELEEAVSGHGQSGRGGDAPGNESLERIVQIESLQKALKEKQRVCRKMEEKLAIAHSVIAVYGSNKEKQSDQRKAPTGERDDKGVQVEAQDLGYETSGRSETEVEGSSTDVDGVLRLVPILSPVLAGTQDRFSPDTTASSPSYPSSPGLSSPRPSDPHADPTLHIQQLRLQIEGQHKVIQHLQRQLRKKSLSSELLSVTSDPTAGEEEEETKMMKSQIAQLSTELERERTLNRSSQAGSPSRIESLVQSQARELCELREQIRVSRGLGVEQRKQFLELRRALEELLQPDNMYSAQGTQLREQLDHSLSLLERLEQVSTGGSGTDNEEEAESEMKLRLSAKLQEKDWLIQSLQYQLRIQVPRMHQCSDSEMSDRLSVEGTTSFHDSPPAGRRQTPNRPHTGLMATNSDAFSDTGLGSGGVVDGEEGSVGMLQRENGHLQEQLRSSEELNATLRSELDLTRSVLKHNPQKKTKDKQSEQQNTSESMTINSDLLVEHLQEIRALRQRLEETIRTNERLREQLERKLQEAEKDSAATNIFIAGSEEQAHISSELHFLLAQNHTLKEQLNQGARDKQKENDRLRETLARRTAKLELSRKECETLKQERTQLQDNLYRLQCENSHQRQQLCDTQQLLQSVRVELQVHDHMKNSTHTHTGEGHGSGSESGSAADLSELLAEIRKLRVQLERSIQINTTLTQRLEQQLLTRTDPRSTININYLLPKTDEAGKSDVLHLHTDASSAAHDSGSSVDSGSHVPSRLVPGHRLWADRRGRHVLGLIEDYNALRKQINEAKRLTADLDTQIHDCGRAVDQLKSVSGSVNTMQQALEEAARLLKLLWRVSVPSGDSTHTQQIQI